MRGRRWLRVFAVCLFSLLCAGIGRAQEKWDAVMPIRGFCVAAPMPDRVDEFVKFIHEELAPRHVNTLILRVDYNYQYESHPELREPVCLTKADAKRLVAACKQHQIHIIPHINLLGHQSWASDLGALLRVYPELDETPNIKMPAKGEKPDENDVFPSGLYYCKSYCPLHPKLHDIVFALADELCDVFETDAFHGGMDEVFYIGERACPRCGGRDKAELFAGEVRSLHDHLALKKRTLWIWGDRLIDGKTTGLGAWEASLNSTHRAIDLIPKDVMICDWHYERAEPTPVLFAMKGLRVVTCPWNKSVPAVQQVDDMVRFREQSNPEMKQYFQGLVETTWSDAASFLDDYYGRKKNSHGDESMPACFKAAFEEIRVKVEGH